MDLYCSNSFSCNCCHTGVTVDCLDFRPKLHPRQRWRSLTIHYRKQFLYAVDAARFGSPYGEHRAWSSKRRWNDRSVRSTICRKATSIPTFSQIRLLGVDCQPIPGNFGRKAPREEHVTPIRLVVNQSTFYKVSPWSDSAQHKLFGMFTAPSKIATWADSHNSKIKTTTGKKPRMAKRNLETDYLT